MSIESGNEEYNPYFRLMKGKTVTMSEIRSSIPFIKPSVDTLLNEGKVVGQYTLDRDIVMWLGKK